MPSIPEIVPLAWRLYADKVANRLLIPDNEKMMQLQLAQILQSLAPVFERRSSESYKVLLEVPVNVGNKRKIIDVVVEHALEGKVARTAIELKCFRLYGRQGNGKRGAQNLGMYAYWEDIENIEAYCSLPDFDASYQFTLTDDPYYVETPHSGSQVATYSTCRTRGNVTGALEHAIKNRQGRIVLRGNYRMNGWTKGGEFYFIQQRARSTELTSKIAAVEMASEMRT
jgi:hypothetical protein